MSTKVKVMCISKKESKNWDEKHPIQTTIELEVPYDVESIYYKLSGGTNFELMTINQAAADMFRIGDYYDVVIAPSREDENKKA